MCVIFPALRAGLSDSSEDDQSGLHHPGLTLLAPQVVPHSYAPHPSSRALLHKAHHPGWYGPHLPLEALLHSPAFPPSPSLLDSPSPGAHQFISPQDIYSNFLQECHVRKAFKAFVTQMPGKQGCKPTLHHHSKALLMLISFMATSHPLGMGHLQESWSLHQEVCTPCSLILHNAEYSEP